MFASPCFAAPHPQLAAQPSTSQFTFPLPGLGGAQTASMGALPPRFSPPTFWGNSGGSTSLLSTFLHPVQAPDSIPDFMGLFQNTSGSRGVVGSRMTSDPFARPEILSRPFSGIGGTQGGTGARIGMGFGAGPAARSRAALDSREALAAVVRPGMPGVSEGAELGTPTYSALIHEIRDLELRIENSTMELVVLVERLADRVAAHDVQADMFKTIETLSENVGHRKILFARLMGRLAAIEAGGGRSSNADDGTRIKEPVQVIAQGGAGSVNASASASASASAPACATG